VAPANGHRDPVLGNEGRKCVDSAPDTTTET